MGFSLLGFYQSHRRRSFRCVSPLTRLWEYGKQLRKPSCTSEYERCDLARSGYTIETVPRSGQPF